MLRHILFLYKISNHSLHQKNKAMKPEQKQWSKAELKTYISLLCANADLIETGEEFNLIKSKTSAETLDRMYWEFRKNYEDECFKKNQNAVGRHKYAYKQLSELKKEIPEVVFSDKKLLMNEHTLRRMSDNILY